MRLRGMTGPQALGKLSGEGDVRLGHTGEVVTSTYLADYAQAGLDGISFSAANQAAQAVSVALATTYTGLCLYNPLGSGVILVPKLVKYALSVAPAAIAPIGLIAGYAATGGVTAETTPLIVQSSQIGNGSRGKARAFSAATIATPTWLQQLWGGFTAAALPAPQAVADLRGAFQILPGGFIAVGALTAVTGLGSIVWDEVSINS